MLYSIRPTIDRKKKGAVCVKYSKTVANINTNTCKQFAFSVSDSARNALYESHTQGERHLEFHTLRPTDLSRLY